MRLVNFDLLFLNHVQDQIGRCSEIIYHLLMLYKFSFIVLLQLVLEMFQVVKI